MRNRACLALASALASAGLAVAGCSSSTSPEVTDAGAMDAARADSGARDGATVDAPEGPSACVIAGGVCGCAGGCSPGYHPAPAPLLDACPQPCDGCGACSQQCCLPDDAGVPSSCGGATCTGGERCIHPCCGGAGPVCEPLPDGGVCGADEPCALGDGQMGCRRLCTPPPPYCSSTIPAGCMDDGTGGVICLCA